MDDSKKNVQDMNDKFINLLQNDFIVGMRYCNETVAKDEDRLNWNINIIRFKTNASQIKIKYSVSNCEYGNYPHLGITARYGLSIVYRSSEKAPWKRVDCISFNNGGGIITKDMQRFDIKNEFYEVMIYGPILASFDELYIGIEKNKILRSIVMEDKKKILFMGGIHTFGIGATSSSLIFPNIIARKYDCFIYNVSFNSANYMKHLEKSYNSLLKLIKTVDLVVFEYDYIRLEVQDFIKYGIPFIEKLVKINCNIIFWRSIFCDDQNTTIKGNMISNIINSDKILMISKNYIIENKELYMYSSNFINDAGHVYYAKRIIEILREIK